MYLHNKKKGKEKENHLNNEMAINTYLSTIESKKQNKQTSRTQTASQIHRVF